jgi:hypothetical protein
MMIKQVASNVTETISLKVKEKAAANALNLQLAILTTQLVWLLTRL